LVYPAIGDVPLAGLKRSHIVRLLDQIEDQCGTKMADLTLAYVRRIFGWHASRVDDFSSPIVRGMGRYDSKARERSRTLSDDELRRIWVATEPESKAPNPFHALLRFLLLTGARRNEARYLPWDEINGTDWKLPASRNKVKVDLTRPLSKAAQAVIAGQPRIDGGPFVFTNDGRPMSLSKPKAVFDAMCDVSSWRLHDLRRTCRTLMARAGINADVAEICLGHRLGGVRAVYDRFGYQSEMAHAFEAVAALIERITNPPAGVITPLRRPVRPAP
jgi:integrase